MLRAKVRIESGGNVFEIGQSVTGLSKADKEWLTGKGYAEEVKSEKKEEKADEE
jgi:hypothetical protein